MEITWAIVIIVAVIIVWCMWQKNQCNPIPRDDSGIERLGGYGVTSSLHFYDRIAYCDEGNDQGYSGGCFLPHKVII